MVSMVSKRVSLAIPTWSTHHLAVHWFPNGFPYSTSHVRTAEEPPSFATKMNGWLPLRISGGPALKEETVEAAKGEIWDLMDLIIS